MFREFKEFALRGNVLDLAIGVIIGAAFSKIITSLVEDVVMPPIGYLFGGADFTNLFYTISEGNYATLDAAKKAGAATINYGLFLNALLQFFLVALILFLIIRQANRMRRHPEEATPAMKDCPFCLSAVPAAATRCAHCTSEMG